MGNVYQRRGSSGAQDDVDARVGPDGLAELADFEAEGGLLEGPLHGAAAEGAQVAAFFRRRTVGELGRQFGERRPAADDLLAVARQQRRRLVRRSEPKKKQKNSNKNQNRFRIASLVVLFRSPSATMKKPVKLGTPTRCPHQTRFNSLNVLERNVRHFFRVSIKEKLFQQYAIILHFYFHHGNRVSQSRRALGPTSGATEKNQ